MNRTDEIVLSALRGFWATYPDIDRAKDVQNHRDCRIEQLFAESRLDGTAGDGVFLQPADVAASLDRLAAAGEIP